MLNLGLGHPGTYTVSLRVVSNTNTVDAFTTLTVVNTPPLITVNAPATATVGVPYSIAFTGTELGSDPITHWKVTWGDGTTSDLASDATTATHVYNTAQVAPIPVTVTAQDVNGSYSANPVLVTVNEGAASIASGGPYTVAAGSSLVLSASSFGSPTSFSWDINGDGVYGDATGAQVTLSWASLQALLTSGGTVHDGPQTINGVSVKVSYADGVSGHTVVSAPTSLTILDTPPTATFTGTNTTKGGSSTVAFTNPSDFSTAATQAGFQLSDLSLLAQLLRQC